MRKLKNRFGEQVKLLRSKTKLTQELLADRCGLEPSYIGAVERGERNLTIDNIEKIANGLGINPYRLFLFDFNNLSEEKMQEKLTAEIILDELKKLPDHDKAEVLNIFSKILRTVGGKNPG